MANVQAVSPIAPRTYAYVVLTVALISAAIALILMRLALNTGIPSPVIVAVRMTIAIAVFTPLALRSHPQAIRQLRRRDWLLLPLAGFFFASDLTLFSESIKHTSILIATVIGGLSPLWTALLERLVLKAPLHRMVYIGLTLALGGGVLIALARS
ncbi:MAG: DMT family transporter, partial [Anaerolineae bacterium]|nr:DMT family transporter [Anaerolineae bacterium]